MEAYSENEFEKSWIQEIEADLMKVGIIRCQQTEIYCPATTCLLNATKGEGGFSESGPVEVIGVNSCGGCPGKQVYVRAIDMKKRGAEKIVLASCIFKGALGYLDILALLLSSSRRLLRRKCR